MTRKLIELNRGTDIETFLSKLWFSERKADEPIYLNLEEEFLQTHGLSHSKVVSEICQKALEELDLNKPRDIFYSSRRKLNKWKQSDQQVAPPVLSIIGASILAALNMHTDDKYSANAYYPRLSALLNHEVPREKLSAEYDNVVLMWEALHEWIENNQSLGPSMISSLGGKSRIGYPRSQASITVRDRQILSQIKTRIGHKKFQQSNRAELLEEIRIWTSRNSGYQFSTAFKTSLSGTDADIHAFLIQALKSAPFIESFIGTKEIRTQAELWYDFTSEEFTWVVPKDPTLADFIGKDSDGHQITVHNSFVPEIWKTDYLPKVTATTLESERVWAGQGNSILIPKRKYWLFHDVSSADAVMSFRGEVTERQFSLLAPAGLVQELSDAQINREKTFVIRRNVFVGWDFFGDVPSEYKDGFLNSILTKAIVTNSEKDAPNFSLTGGISLKSLSGTKTYLEGYEPDLVVDPSVDSYTLVLDGDKTQDGLKATGYPLPYSRFSSNHGIRRLEVPGIWSTKYLVSSAEESWRFSKIELEIQTCNIELKVPKLSARRDRYYFSISINGRIEELTYCGQPTWLQLRNREFSKAGFETNFQNFYPNIPDDCIWFVGLHESRRPIVKRTSDRDMIILEDSILESADVWNTFFEFIQQRRIEELDVLLYLVNGVLR